MASLFTLPFTSLGLLVLVCPTYKPKPKRLRSRLLACPPLDRDLLADANQLVACGHPTAAAMTCRVEIERLLTTLAMKQEKFGPYWLGIQRTADWLYAKLLIRRRTYVAVTEAVRIGNEAAHGRPVTLSEFESMRGAILSLRAKVAKVNGSAAKGGAA